jgi:hypothetical protein
LFVHLKLKTYAHVLDQKLSCSERQFHVQPQKISTPKRQEFGVMGEEVGGLDDFGDPHSQKKMKINLSLRQFSNYFI